MARTLEVRIVGDSRSLEQAFGRAQTKGEKFGQSLNKLAKGSAVFLGAVAIGVNKATDAASNLGEQINKTTVVFRGSEKDVLAWSKTTADAIGMSQRAALEYAGTFGNMLVPMGIARDKAADMSKQIVGLAGDMASFNNASPEETLEALRAGLSGETEPLRRFGVFLNEARIKAEALSSGLVKTEVDTAKLADQQNKANKAHAAAAEALQKHGRGSQQYKDATIAAALADQRLEKTMAGKVPALTASQKAMAIYRLILGDTADAQGDFARTSDSQANAERRRNAEIENASASIGKGLLPVTQALTDWTAKLASFTGDHAREAKIATGVLVGLAGGVIAVNAGFKAYQAAVRLAAAATWLFNAALAANPIVLIVAGLAALGIGLVVAYKKSETFRNVVNGAFEAVRKVVGKALGFVLFLFDKWLGGFQAVFEAAGHIPGVGGKFDAVSEAIGRAREKLRALKREIEGTKGKTVTVGVRFQVAGGRVHDTAHGVVGEGLQAATQGALARGVISPPTTGRAGAGGLSPWVQDELAIGRSLGLGLTSGLRPGARTATGRPSLHGVGQAIDMAGDPRMMAMFAQAVAGRSGVAEVLYTPLGGWYPGVGWTKLGGQLARDHYSHVHVGVRSGDGLIGDGRVVPRRPRVGKAPRRALRRTPKRGRVRGKVKRLPGRAEEAEVLDPIGPSAELPAALEEAIFDADSAGDAAAGIAARQAAIRWLESQLALAGTPEERLPIKRAIKGYRDEIADLSRAPDPTADQQAILEQTQRKLSAAQRELQLVHAGIGAGVFGGVGGGQIVFQNLIPDAEGARRAAAIITGALGGQGYVGSSVVAPGV